MRDHSLTGARYALAYLPIVQMLIRRNPGKLDADRFREAWLRLAEGAFTGVPPT